MFTRGDRIRSDITPAVLFAGNKILSAVKFSYRSNLLFIFSHHPVRESYSLQCQLYCQNYTSSYHDQPFFRGRTRASHMESRAIKKQRRACEYDSGFNRVFPRQSSCTFTTSSARTSKMKMFQQGRHELQTSLLAIVQIHHNALPQDHPTQRVHNSTMLGARCQTYVDTVLSHRGRGTTNFFSVPSGLGKLDWKRPLRKTRARKWYIFTTVQKCKHSHTHARGSYID